MPVFDLEKKNPYADPLYTISLLEEEEKEEEVLVIPERPETVSDLRDSESFRENGRVVLEYLADNKNATEKIFSASLNLPDSPTDYIEFLRDEDNRLPTLFMNAGLYEEAPENVLKAYKNIRQRFDDADLGSFTEFMGAAGDITTDIVTDPVNFLGLLALPFSGGASGAARIGAQQLAKKTVQRNIAARLQAFATPATVGALEGGVFGGLDDYGRQTRDIAVGLQEATEIDKGRVALSAGIGAGLGAGLGKLIDVGMSKLDKKNIARAANPEETTAMDLAEQGMVGDLIDKEGIKEAKERLGLDEDTTDFIEGVFSIIDDEDAVNEAVKKYAAKNNISQEGQEELLEDLMANFKESGGSKGGVAASLNKIVSLSKQAPAYYGGRVSTFLDPYTAKSETIKKLQRKFRYDSQRTFFGDRVQEGQDYAETLGDTLGGYYVDMKEAIDPVLVSNQGRNRDDAYRKLTAAVRGVKSNDTVIDNAASRIRRGLDKAAEDLKEAGLYDDASFIKENYFPRIWDRKAIKDNEKEFAQRLIKSGEAKDGGEASNIIASMLDKKEMYGDEAGSGNFFLSKRKFKFTDDALFEKFLDSDAQNVLNTYYNQISKQLARKKVFGATKWTDFEKLYRSEIEKELGPSESRKAIKDLKTVWMAQTGENATSSNLAIDSVTTMQRVALLPLATFSSLTEVLLNLSRGGVYNTVKGFAKATKDGTKHLTYGMVDKVMKNHGLSKPETFRKLQRFGIAFEQATSDQVERLSGESITNPTLQKINRGFFRLNLLEPWTKTVQLTSFNVGKDIIRDNLKSIARHGDKKITARIQTKIDQLLELNVDIDKGLSWYNKTKGDLDIENDFTFQIERGAARYTNEIILNPSRESGLKSLALSYHPLTTMLFQLSAYPAAFTNTVLKDMVKRTARGIKQGDIGASSKVIGTALSMQASAMMLNYYRNEFFNKDPEYIKKTKGELLIDGASRWGGMGIYLDVAQRSSKASEFLGPIAGPIAGFTGPVVGQFLSATKGYTYSDPFVSMMPFYSALPKETRKEIRSGVKEFEKELIGDKPRPKFDKGGKVLDVPQVPKEPDERIDKMTGLPYNQQAGTAFTDVEDREDPLQRRAFVVGGIAKILSKTIKDFSKRVVNDAEADEAAEEILKVYKSGDPDIPSELDDEDFVAFLDLETKALLEEKHDLSMDQLRSKYPQFIGDKDELIMGEDFSRARGYTEDEIETYNIASELGDELGDSAQEATSNIQYILDSKGLTDKRPKSNVKESLSRLLAQKEAKHLALKDEEIPILEKGLGADYKEKIAALSPEDRSILESLEVPDMPTRVEKVRDVDIENRDQALKDFIKDSKEKEPVFRGTSDAFDTDYEFSFAMPRELGTHVGTKGQAASLLTRPLPMNITTFMGEVPEKTIDTAMKAGEISNKAMTKGYINVKNPLVFEEDLGSWGAEELLAPNNIQDFISLVAKQNNQKGVTSEVIGASLKRKVIPYLDRFTEMSMEGGSDTLEYSIHQAKLNKELQSFLKDFGFDSVKYKNQFEARIEGESPYSYILFEPEQFKSTFAARFDKADPRQNKADGGLLAKKDMSMYRADGSKKSNRGFIGQVKNNVDGGIMTEASIGIEIEGKEVSMPAMVPTLTAKEIEILSNMKIEGNAKNIPRSIINKAIKHAKKRRAEGKSPFYQDGEEG